MDMHAGEQDWYPHLIGDVTPRRGGAFPYVVVKLAPSLFERWPVRFVSPDDSWPGEDAVVVPHPQPEATSSHARDLLVDEVRRRAKERDLSMSVVFSATDAVRVCPDGSTEHTTDPPRGGMQMVGVSPPR